VYSVSSDEEAKALIAHACFPHPVYGYVAQELATEQTIDNLMSFGERLGKLHNALKSDPDWLEAAERYDRHIAQAAEVRRMTGTPLIAPRFEIGDMVEVIQDSAGGGFWEGTVGMVAEIEFIRGGVINPNDRYVYAIDVGDGCDPETFDEDSLVAA
jgi:hypothetical protein